jgi:hypothetical protein
MLRNPLHNELPAINSNLVICTHAKHLRCFALSLGWANLNLRIIAAAAAAVLVLQRVLRIL